MTNVKPTYPGVYIEELAGLSLAIGSGATAVPVFPYESTLSGLKASEKINSWLAFMELMKGPEGKTTTVKVKEKNDKGVVTEKEVSVPAFEFNEANLLHLSLRTYFENGGGYCYIVHKDNLLTEVPKLDDATLLVAAGQDIKSAVAQLCNRDNMLFAILDGNNGESPAFASGKAPDTNPYAAVYYPWLKADWAKNDVTVIPPSAAVAGAYCSVDRDRGVWKAPANVSLKGGVTPAYKVTDEKQSEHMDDTPINMIRTFRGQGTTLWGARTLAAGNDINQWRYIPVRRLFNTAQRDIKRAMGFAMFEPNSQPTWERVRAAVDSYLNGIWKQGGLMGSTQKEAYFVQIGKDITMTEEEIKDGKMIVKIGMAAVRPAEFIILQFTQNVAQG